MWPLERNAVHECVRVGRHAVERWAGSRAALALVGHQALPAAAAPQPTDLVTALLGLYVDKPSVKVTLVLESAWLPLMLADTGVALETTEVEALLRHRLGMQYADDGDPVSGWDLRVEHRVGDRFALGYGLPSGLKRSLVEAAHGIGLEWAALLPAFAWGRDRLRPTRGWAGRSGWWVWPEQDRTLLGRLVDDRVVALNAGAAISDGLGVVEGLVDAERARQGMASSTDAIGIATWGVPPPGARDDGRATYFDIAGQPPSKVPGPAARSLLAKAGA